MTWYPDDGQPGPGRWIRLLAGSGAFLVTLAALGLALLSRSLPPVHSGLGEPQAIASLALSAFPFVAGASAALGIVCMVMLWTSQRRAPGAESLVLGLSALVLILGAGGLAVLNLSPPGPPELPTWLARQPVVVWLSAHGAPLIALVSGGFGLLSVLLLRALRHGTNGAESMQAPESTEMERLRRQIAPLASGDLAVRVREGQGAWGEVALTLNLLIGAVSDLVTVSDEAAVQLLGLVQDLRARSTRLQAEGETGRQLATELTEQSRRLMGSAHGLAERIRSAEVGGSRSSRRPPAEEPAATEAQLSTGADVAGIVDVVADLAEQARVLAVEIGIQAASGGHSNMLQGIGDDVQRFAERAARAVRQIEPMANLVVADARAAPIGDRLDVTPRQAANLAAAATALAEQLATIPENGARLQDIAVRLGGERDETQAFADALSELAQGLRRSASRFRVAG